jgi:type VI secretion system protein ImpL
MIKSPIKLPGAGILSALMKEGVLSIVVLILLIALVWFGGEFLKTPENDLFKERVAIIAVLIGIFLVLFMAQKAMAVKNAVRIEKQLKAQSGSQLVGADADRKSEIEALSKKFAESLEALKKTKGGKSALFTLPWYIIIGPPGSGKTTALQESGLNFPAVQGGAKVRGIGGTRNCDWWFTEDGILLDTAGRYTTVAEDQDEWFAFLDMIRTSRKQKPINGAIVAIAVDELYRATQGEIDQMAKDVRNRLDELAARLQAVFPVYMMFTKCDLIQGFVEYFEDFNKDQRGQVWGCTFPYRLPDKQYTEIFSEEVAKMGANIEARQLELLATERPPHKKQSIYLFPRQFALANEKMKEFLGALFNANAFQESAMLRGIYFTSGTQKGTPIDQILARMGEAMGMGSAPQGSEDRVEKKSYFIHNLFTNIIFADRTLARSNSRVIRKRRAMQLALSLGSLVALVLMGWVLLQSFIGNHEIITKVEAAGVAVRDLPPSSQPSAEDLRLLDRLRFELAEIDKDRREGRPLRLSFGMYQGKEMFDAGASLYFGRLRPLYIAPTGVRIEKELTDLVNSLTPSSPSDDYQRLLDLWRVYRMLGGELEPQAPLISSVLKKESRWTGRLGGSDSVEAEALAGEQLEFYASQLALTDKEADPFALYIKIDSMLSKRASDKLQTAFWSTSAHEAIIQFTSEKRKPLRLQDLVPNNHEYLELRTEGTDATNLARLNAFTQEAWDTDVKSLINERAKDLAKLYGELGMATPEEEIRAELYERHRKAQIAVWDLFLEQTYPKASVFSGVKETNEALKVLAGDMSPYRDLVKNVWARRQLTLAPDNIVPGPSDEETKALDAAMAALVKFKDSYNLFWTKTGREKGSRIMTHMDNKEPLPALATAFIDAARDVPSPFPTRDEKARIAFTRLIDVAFDAVRAEADAEVKDWWKDSVTSLWSSSFKGRFPFVLKGTEDVTMTNFSTMFAPKGGRIWNVDRRLRAVDAIAFHNGRKLVSITQEYENTIAQARDITEAMYDTENEDSVKVQFSAKLTQTGLLVESMLEVGTNKEGVPETLPYNKYPKQTRDFIWTQWNNSNAMGARVTAKYTEAKKTLPGKDLMDKEWGLLKMMRSPWARSFSVTEVDGMPKYSVLWEFTSPDQQLFYLQCEITPRKKQNPFQEDLFTKFTVAETVSK